jgi:hypothetical protein
MTGVAVEDDRSRARGWARLGDQPAEVLRRRPGAQAAAFELRHRRAGRKVEQVVLQPGQRRHQRHAAGGELEQQRGGGHINAPVRRRRTSV